MPITDTRAANPAGGASFKELDGRGPSASGRSGSAEWVFAAAIFLSAFLLFQVQLIAGKYLLPWFGGASGVWTACMLFFQAMLLAGYAYSHGSAVRLSPRAQSRMHLGLLLAALLALLAMGIAWKAPLLASSWWKPQSVGLPVAKILGVLTVAVGLPFFVLSATGPLLQEWFRRVSPERPVYRLYAVSNVGSLLGLLTYPFLIEPSLTLRGQAWTWFGLFAIFAAACAWCALRASAGTARSTEAEPEAVPEPAPTWMQKSLWFALAAGASAALLAATNVITLDIASIPLLWVLPLTLYLLSFIVVFADARFYRRELFHPLLWVTLIMATVTLYRLHSIRPFAQIYVFCLTLFAICMVCHGELARSRPNARFLTSFYLAISAGGVAGGALVSLAAPYLFRGFWEFHLVLWLAAGLMLLAVAMDKTSWWHSSFVWVPRLVLMGITPLPFYLATQFAGAAKEFNAGYYAVPVAMLYLTVRAGWRNLRTQSLAAARLMRVISIILLGALGYYLYTQAMLRDGTIITRQRNFYGVITVYEQHTQDPQLHAYTLSHGRTRHGTQLQTPQLRRAATSYYSVKSGVGAAVLHHPKKSRNGDQQMRIGVIGLGAGTVASYALPGDVVRFYEINPQVVGLSRGDKPVFTFLKDSFGQAEIVEGDARLEMERELERGEPQKYDVLAVDAFSGDSIPVHLLTKEAIALYLNHLRDNDSIIAIHVSNHALDLAPVVTDLAEYHGLHGMRVRNPNGPAIASSQWVLLSRNPAVLQADELLQIAPLAKKEGLRLWTDDYSNLWSVFRR